VSVLARFKPVETALVIPVPEADPVIGRWRWTYTASGAEGMPAHITLIYPFADASEAAATMGRIEGVLSDVAAFEYRLASTDYFPGTRRTLFLEPEPRDPLVALTDALAGEFPEYPPYGGAFAETVPHVTLAQHDGDELASIEDEVKRSLPIAARATSVALFEHAAPPHGWRLRHEFGLA
jgi:2'-5' RNA ligase